MDSKQQHHEDLGVEPAAPPPGDVAALVAALAEADPSAAPVLADQIAELLGKALSAPEAPPNETEPSP